MELERNDEHITKELGKIIDSGKGRHRRIDAKTEAYLQTAIARIRQKEKQESEKLTQFRRAGVGLSANSILQWAIRIAFAEEKPPFDEKRHVDDRQLLPGEKEAVPKYIEKPSDAQIVERRARKLIEETKRKIEKEEELDSQSS